MTPTTIAGGRRERSKADKRARILAAASAGLERDGYDKMTMASVAHAADVAAGTVFQYAASKPELLMMVVADRWRRDFPHVLEQADGHDDPVEAILALLEPFVTASAHDPANTMAVARELLFGQDGVHRDAVLAEVDQLERRITDIIGADAPPEAARAAARMVISAGLVELNRARQGMDSWRPLPERLATLVSLALNGARASR
ncbi:TetR/AcrR family transcriptional regulator [Propioniciclava soli]|uniref:TetR/AcrR family transcriptional regulator n=1 Tax=Propioniciclava soli TaxID=2775081 RepID=A0ABZ3CAP8_9ACTN|nr:TetR/AcrR family transcriptional regulator [Propioniciclava soli]